MNGAGAGTKPSALPVAIVALAGAGLVLALATVPPAGSGARSAFTPATLLAAFDVVWVLLLARPGARSLPETAALLGAGAPFHAVAAGEARGGAGHLGGFALLALAWTGAGLAAARGGPVAVGGVAFAAFGLPLAAYAASEFLLRAPLTSLFLASPATGPVLLARSAPTASASDAVPAVVAAALVASSALLRRRPAEAS